jgi:hypothetical protein
LFAHVEDIARFVMAGMTDSYSKQAVLSGQSIQAIHAPQVDIPGMFGVVADSYGFGHFIEVLSDGRKAVWHGGQGHGWMTHFHAVPESGDGIVILTNSQRSWPFIAEVLSNWARWCGFGSVKFTRIKFATSVFLVMICIVALVSLSLAYRLVRGLLSCNRRFAPFSRKSLGIRLLQATLGLAGITALVWSATRPYTFVSSIFPGTAAWAGATFIVLAAIMVVSALFPRIEKSPESTLI